MTELLHPKSHTDRDIHCQNSSYVSQPCSLPLYGLRGLILKIKWISNYIPCKVWDKILYPFPNCNGATVEVC